MKAWVLGGLLLLGAGVAQARNGRREFRYCRVVLASGDTRGGPVAARFSTAATAVMITYANPLAAPGTP